MVVEKVVVLVIPEGTTVLVDVEVWVVVMVVVETGTVVVTVRLTEITFLK